VEDVMILGAGPAGMTAAIYCARKQMSVRLLTEDIGGQTLWSAGVENYLGYEFIKGADLADKFQDHLKKFPVEIIYHPVVSIASTGAGFEVTDTTGAKFTARAVIVATGKSPRQLGVTGESDFRGRGVTYCAICDAPLFADQEVAVVGGGNSGVEAAIQLAGIASRVYLVEAEPRLAADEVLVTKLGKSPNVEVLTSTTVTEIHGDVLVTGVTVMLPDRTSRDIPVTGVFIEIGLTPNSACVSGLVKLNQTGEIIVDRAGRTSVAGVFAAGDVTDEPDKQIIIAAGDGARAALTAYDYLIRR
jgi:NADH-dependent peroxiredoxin subunit F